jgi:hypothetical protein
MNAIGYSYISHKPYSNHVYPNWTLSWGPHPVDHGRSSMHGQFIFAMLNHVKWPGSTTSYFDCTLLRAHENMEPILKPLLRSKIFFCGPIVQVPHLK